MVRFLTIFLCVFLWPLCVTAQTAESSIKLSYPVSCALGTTCWVVNYVNVSSVEGKIQDFACGPRSYEEHSGTDFAVRDWQEMLQGTPVLAAADGKILRVRNDIEDHDPTADEIAQMKIDKKGCGNGVFIDHGDGWQTIYCHMKKDSIIVKPEQIVKAGQTIGEVGQSGVAEFPHLHFGVFRNGTTIDPFTGMADTESCGQGRQGLWEKETAYTPVSLIAAGFQDSVPDFEVIKKDMSAPERLAADSPALTFWGVMLGVMEGDKITMEITDPLGRIFAQREMTQEKTRARQFYFIGKKTRDKKLVTGSYTGTLRLTRRLPDGRTLSDSITKTLEIF